jgi:hypothetical protein
LPYLPPVFDFRVVVIESGPVDSARLLEMGLASGNDLLLSHDTVHVGLDLELAALYSIIS